MLGAASELARLYGLLWAGNKTLLFSKTSEGRSHRQWGTAAQRRLLLSNTFKGRFFKGLKEEFNFCRSWEVMAFCRQKLDTRSTTEHNSRLNFEEGMALCGGFSLLFPAPSPGQASSRGREVTAVTPEGRGAAESFTHLSPLRLLNSIAVSLNRHRYRAGDGST